VPAPPFSLHLSHTKTTITHTHTINTTIKKQKKHQQDIEAIDSLADAINKYDGGVVLVSHDFRLIDQVAKSIWVCEGKAVTPWSKGIREYKALLARRMKKTM
jgi:ATP-binding cassette subfamily F protein 2